ncbi:hypothetical protein VTN02DRAFT_4795 [Thermoascus thermophilus]
MTMRGASEKGAGGGDSDITAAQPLRRIRSEIFEVGSTWTSNGKRRSGMLGTRNDLTCRTTTSWPWSQSKPHRKTRHGGKKSRRCTAGVSLIVSPVPYLSKHAQSGTRGGARYLTRDRARIYGDAPIVQISSRVVARPCHRHDRFEIDQGWTGIHRDKLFESFDIKTALINGTAIGAGTRTLSANGAIARVSKNKNIIGRHRPPTRRPRSMKSVGKRIFQCLCKSEALSCRPIRVRKRLTGTLGGYLHGPLAEGA